MNKYGVYHNKGKIGGKIIYCDYVEYREGHALFWENNPPPDGKNLISMLSLKKFLVIKEK